jgi:ATP/maltotriose-dependent transcriptional regulator MalT
MRPVQAIALAMTGRFAESRAIQDDHIREQRERGEVQDALAGAMTSGWLEVVADDLVRADAILREAWVGLGELGERGYRSTVGGIFADVLARAGAYDDAEVVADEAEALATPDDWVTVTGVTLARARIASGRGDHDRAVRLARDAVAQTEAREYLSHRHDMWWALGEILLAAGREEEAREALAQGRELALQKGSSAVVDRIDALLRGRS